GVPGLVTCPAAAPDCQDPFMPDGCYDLPAAVFANPAAPIGIRVNASGLFVPIQCAQATAGGICASGEGCLVDGDCATAPCTLTTDVVCPTPTADLPSCPITAGNTCAELTGATISPLQVTGSDPINLSSSATDANGDPIDFLWTATNGTITDPTAPATTYTCDTLGTHTITITVSDDNFVNCNSSVSGIINCL
ncbi:MAG: PKD domain-containing protein, partial [Myxococcota bacterium]